jgi:hypothetical protein
VVRDIIVTILTRYLESGALSAVRRSVVVSEIPTHQTSMGGPGYVHPRSDKYRDKFNSIFRGDELEEDDEGDE